MKKKKKTKRYAFKYALNRFINEYKDIITPLSQEQINTTNHIFEQIETYLTQKIFYQFIIYKIFDKIISKEQDRVWVDLAYFSSPFTKRWNMNLNGMNL